MAESDRGVPLEALAVLYRRLATLVAAGVTIDQGLSLLTDHDSGRLKVVLERITHKVQQGSSLGRALSAYPRAFSPVALGLIQAAERSGALVTTLGRLADLAERDVRLKRMLLSALTYPTILALGILGLGAFVVLVICPGDQGLFGAFGGELPWPSRVLAELSGWLRRPGPLLGGAAIVAAGLMALRRGWQASEEARYRADEWLLRVPLVGRLIRKITAARILYVMGTTLGVGLTQGAALALAGQVVTNRVLRRSFEEARQEVVQGEKGSHCLRRHRVLPAMATSMLEVGEESGTLDSTLRRIADLYDEEIEASLVQLARMVEPMLLAAGGVMACFVALAALMPILDVANRL